MNITADGAAFAAEAAARLEEASATEIIQWAADTFGDRLCLTASMAGYALATEKLKGKSVDNQAPAVR